MVVHTVHKGCSSDISGVHDTHEERAPIIDGLCRAPPRPRAAGHLITVNNTDTQTGTQTKYSNPCCACTPRVKNALLLRACAELDKETFQHPCHFCPKGSVRKKLRTQSSASVKQPVVIVTLLLTTSHCEEDQIFTST